jgi:hypothetical protein
MSRPEAQVKRVLVALLTVASVSASAQAPKNDPPKTDAEKITDALRAGPNFITKDATILDWPTKPGGEYRVLRKGTSEWTCLPGFPNYPHDEPGCFDPVFMQWTKDGLAGRAPQITGVGIAYMYAGAWVPHAGNGSEPADKYYHVGPHIMIVTPNQADLRGYNTNGSNGMPYFYHLPGRSEMFVVITIREWSEPPR